MKKIFKVIIIVLVILSVFFIGNSIGSKRGYNGYTIYYDADSNKGFVYVNNGSSSAAIVTYPKSNEAYIYNIDGQTLARYETIRRLITHEDANVSGNVVAVIVPLSSLN